MSWLHNVFGLICMFDFGVQISFEFYIFGKKQLNLIGAVKDLMEQRAYTQLQIRI